MSSSSLSTPRQGQRKRHLVVIIAALALLSAGAGGLYLTMTRTAVAPATVTVSRGPLVATIAGSGTIVAEQDLTLSFEGSGRVAEVLVVEGQTVAANQPLARLDDRELRLTVASAEASLEAARARLAQAEAGNARPQDLTQAEAGLASAEAGLTRARTGNVTATDIASAEAALQSAQARLDDVRARPRPADLAAAQGRYDQARAARASQTAALSAAKTRAESLVTQQANLLRTVQDDYSRVYWQNRELEQLPGDLPQARIDQAAAAARVVANAEEALAQARVAYAQAVEAEQAGLAAAESALRDAEAQLREVSAGATAEELTQAEAAVTQARATLTRLRQGGTPAEVAQAEAAVTQARASLERLSAPATATDRDIQRAGLAQAEQALAQARLRLDQATLRAPFAGVVTTVHSTTGSAISPSAPALVLIDRAPMHVDLRLSENDVVQVRLGQPVTLAIAALPGWTAVGTVGLIANAAATTGGVVTYRVRVDLEDRDPMVRLGMTADVTIVTAKREATLLVPNTALLPHGADQVAQILTADNTLRTVTVQTGLSDDVNTEILSGLSEGDHVIAVPVVK